MNIPGIGFTNIMKEIESKIQILAQWLYESQYLVVFTGAGISTESGLPDFRGPNGVWTRRDRGLKPITPEVSWDVVKPNAGPPYHFQSGGRVQEILGHLRGAPYNQGVVVPKDRF